MLALLLACTADPEPAPEAAKPPPRAVQVALNWYPEPEFGGYYAALKSGAYRKAGLEVKIVPGGPGVPVLEMLAASKIDVAISGADDLLLRRAKGLDAVAVFAGLQDSPVGLLV
ncbi:MAG: ABC transporter substrate-binding protein, partial [Deltaproteobacteria bacterium]|nr:ABC transporter substrate-binding protein [Deltaproteobacteria bacterium]